MPQLWPTGKHNASRFARCMRVDSMNYAGHRRLLPSEQVKGHGWFRVPGGCRRDDRDAEANQERLVKVIGWQQIRDFLHSFCQTIDSTNSGKVLIAFRQIRAG